LSLSNADLRLDSGRRLLFGGDAQLGGAGDLVFLSGGNPPVERLRIQANGDVGIGTAAPATRLAVQGDLSVSGKLVFPGDAPLSVSGDFAVLTGSLTPQERLRITADGKVGIGTASPSARLQVNGELRVSGDLTVQGKITTTDTINGRNISADGAKLDALLALQQQVKDLQQQVKELVGPPPSPAPVPWIGSSVILDSPVNRTVLVLFLFDLPPIPPGPPIVVFSRKLGDLGESSTVIPRGAGGTVTGNRIRIQAANPTAQGTYQIVP